MFSDPEGYTQRRQHYSNLVNCHYLRPYGRAADPILDTITELKSMAPGQDVRSEEKRIEEQKRKEKTRYWLHAHGAGNLTQLLCFNALGQKKRARIAAPGPKTDPKMDLDTQKKKAGILFLSVRT